MQELERGSVEEAVVKGADLLEMGVIDPEAWSNAMAQKFGESIRPHLDLIWHSAVQELQRRQGRDKSDKNTRTPPSSRHWFSTGLILVLIGLGVGAALVIGIRHGFPKYRQLIKAAARSNSSVTGAPTNAHPAPRPAAAAKGAPENVRTNAPEREPEDLEKRAMKGDVEAQVELGTRCARYGKHEDSDQFAVDYEKAVMWFRAAAERGNAKGQFFLGISYSLGQGVKQSQSEAVNWFRKSAEQNHAGAQYLLGFAYLSGRGVTQNPALAVDWFRKSAEQGNARAQFGLGVCYAQGKGVKQDFAEAVKWMQGAARQGDPRAQCALGAAYASGQGVSQSYAEAVNWYRRAAKQGLVGAQFELGLIYQQGRGVPKDYLEAYKWYDIAIAQAKPVDCLRIQEILIENHRKAATISGVTLSRGEEGTARTPVGEIKIQCVKVEENSAEVIVEGETQPRTIAISSGDTPSDMYDAAIRSRAALENRLTKDQIAEGQRRASAFVPRKEEVASEGEDVARKPGVAGSATATGTGFFVTDDGYLITCAHVVDGADAFRVRIGTNTFMATLIKQDTNIDLALLKVSGTFHGLAFARDGSVKLGDAVFTVGFPNTDLQGVTPKMTSGEISSLAGMRDNPRCFQISVPVQPGNSGGALVDERGNVVGVVAARLDDAVAYEASGALPQNVNYAVKGVAISKFLQGLPELREKLKPARLTADRRAAMAAAEQASVLVVVD